MTVIADQRYCLQIWVVAEAFMEAFAEAFMEVTVDITTEVFTEVIIELASGTELELNYNSSNP